MSDPPDFETNLFIEELSQTEKHPLSKDEQKVMDDALWASVEVADEKKPLGVRAAKTARNSGVKPARRPIKVLTPEEKEAQKIRLAEEMEQREKLQMEKHLESLEKQRSDAISDFDRISRLRSEFSDLRVETDRWNAIRYKARSANPIVTHIEFRRTCGCCSDAGILAMPYMETALGRVYSDPHRMEIGEGRSYDWVREFPGWEEKYRAAGIPEEIVQQIRSYLDGQLASCNEDDEDDEDDDEDEDD